MNRIICLIKRNMKLFLRDKATVFFSFLSTIVLVALYFLFIAKIYTDGMDNPEAGGIAMALSAKQKNYIVYLQMMAGVLILNSMSLAIGAFSTIAKDFESRRVDSFMLTPVKHHELVISYFLTGLLISFCINMFTLILSLIIIGIATASWLTFSAFIIATLVLLISSVISCSIVILLTTLVKSSTAIGVINGIAGTFLGFLCGIYMPYGNLGESTKAIGSLIPFSHLTVWLKQVMLDCAFSQVGIIGEFKNILYSDYFSASSIGFCTLDAPLWLMVLLSACFGLICLTTSYFLFGKRLKK